MGLFSQTLNKQGQIKELVAKVGDNTIPELQKDTVTNQSMTDVNHISFIQ